MKYTYIKVVDPHNGSVSFEVTWRLPEEEQGATYLRGINATVLYPLNGDGLEIKKNASRNAGTFVAGVAKYNGTYKAVVVWEDTYPPVKSIDYPGYLALEQGWLRTSYPYSYGTYVGIGMSSCGIVIVGVGLTIGRKKREK
jgi:hypothetical protein